VIYSHETPDDIDLPCMLCLVASDQLGVLAPADQLGISLAT
jgi:hypothetical protein